MAQALEFDKVDCSYGHNGLQELRPFQTPKSFTANPGEIVVLTGGNGSGKSSFFRAVLGQVPNVTGSIRVLENGKVTAAIVAQRLNDLPYRLAYVPQKPTLMFAPNMTCEALVEMWAQRGRRYRAEGDRRPLFERLSLDRFVSENKWQHTNRLSGGQAQLLALALVAVSDPYLMFLDEPTAALSVNAHAVAVHTMTQLLTLEGRNRIMLIATHDERILQLSRSTVHFP